MRRKMVAVVLSAAVLLTGCTDVPDLEGTVQKMEAEYIAAALLKYDKYYQDGLDYDRSVLEATPTPTPTVTPTPVSSPENTATAGAQGFQSEPASAGAVNSTPEEQLVSLNQIYNQKDIQIRAGHYVIKKSLGNSWARITPREGKKLVVVHFTVRNTGTQKRKVNLLKQKDSLQYQLVVDGSSLGSPLLTILEEDLQFFQQTIAAGKSRQAVLVFEADASLKIKNAELVVSRDGYTAKAALK